MNSKIESTIKQDMKKSLYPFIQIISLLNRQSKLTFSEIAESLEISLSDCCKHIKTIDKLFPRQVVILSDSIQLIQPIALFTESDFYQLNTENHLKVEVIDTCLSTNTLLLERIKKHSKSLHGIIVVANEQIKGRGRREQSWVSELGHSITMSLVWEMDKYFNIQTVPLVVAVAIAKALKQLDILIEIKWPNDLVFGFKKLGGILVESVRKEKNIVLVIGIGINVNPLEIKKSALISVFELNPDIRPSILIMTILKELEKALIDFSKYGFSIFHSEFNIRHRDTGKLVRLLKDNTIILEGIIKEIALDGALIIMDKYAKVHQITASDFSLRVIN